MGRDEEENTPLSTPCQSGLVGCKSCHENDYLLGFVGEWQLSATFARGPDGAAKLPYD